MSKRMSHGGDGAMPLSSQPLRGSRAFTRLSNSVARDPALGPVELTLLAHRLTFVSTTAKYGIRPRIAAAALKTGQDRIVDAIRCLQAHGYLKRDTRRRTDAGGRFVASAFDYPTDKALADPLDEGKSRFLKRSWFGHLSVEATALWLYFRAGAPRGPVRWEKDIKARFPKWGSVRLSRYLGELKDKGLIEYVRHREQDGTFGTASYRLTTRMPDKITSNGKPPHGSDPHLHTSSSYTTFSKKFQEHTDDYLPVASRPERQFERFDTAGDPAHEEALLEACTHPHLLGGLEGDWLYDAEVLAIGGFTTRDPAYCLVVQVCSFEILQRHIQDATRGRASRVILGPAGAMAVRALARALLDRHEAPTSKDACDALCEVLTHIDDRIGQTEDRLNSLELIVKRMLGAAYGSGECEERVYRRDKAAAFMRRERRANGAH